MNSDNSHAPTPPVGVIESLTQGFETVAGHAALLLLPLLLDLFLWFGPRISFIPAIESIETYFQQAWNIAISSYPDQYVEQELQITWSDFSRDFLTIVSGRKSSLASLLGGESIRYPPGMGTPNLMHTEFQILIQDFISPIAPNLMRLDEQAPMLLDSPTLIRLSVPSLMVGGKAKPLPFDFSPPTWTFQNPLTLIGMGLLLALLGFFLGGLYITLIAQGVHEGHLRLGQATKRLPPLLFQLAVFCLLAFVLLTAIRAPFQILAIMVFGMDLTTARLIRMTGTGLMLWFSLFGVFTPHGIFLNERGVFGALWDSVRVVQWNMSSTLSLLLLILVLDTALHYVWALADTGSWLVLFGIVGNAFMSTGLIATTFVYFKDRYRYWRELREELLAELEHRLAEEASNPGR